MSDKHRSEGHETNGLNSENKHRLSNAVSTFHGRSGQARENGQINPQLMDVLNGYVALSSIMLDNVIKASVRSLSKVGGNATVLACEKALVCKGGLKLN